MSSFLKEDLAVGSAGGKSRYPGKFLRVGHSGVGVRRWRDGSERSGVEGNHISLSVGWVSAEPVDKLTLRCLIFLGLA